MKLFVAVINNEYGACVTVHATKRAAQQEVFRYVKEWWHHEIPHRDMPTNMQTACEEYFEDESVIFSGETADIQEVSFRPRKRKGSR